MNGISKLPLTLSQAKELIRGSLMELAGDNDTVVW